MAWDDPYDSGLISSIDPRIQSNPYIDEAAGLRIQNQYLDQQRRQNQQGGFGQALTQEAERNGLDPDVLQRIIKIESGGDPRNQTGSYKGLFQLSNQEFNKYGGGNIFDPTDNIRAGTAKLAAERDAFKEKYGRDPSPTDLYLTHQQGEGGYGQHMANPDRPAWENMFNTGEGRQKGAGWAKQAIWGNIPDQYKKQFGSVDNVTSADFVNMWRNKVEGDNPGVMADGPATGSPAGPPVDTSNWAQLHQHYGRPNMNDDNQAQPPGLMQSLFGGLFGGGQQQGAGGVGGLVGAIDPQKMAYLGMIAKALDPYSNIDPTAMLKNAQLQQQHQAELAQRAQQNTSDLGLRTRHQQFLEDQAAKDKFKLQDFGTDPLSGQKDIRLINPQTGEQRPLQGNQGSVGQDTSGGPGMGGPGQGIGGLGKVPENYNDKGKDEDFLKAVEQQYGGVVAKSVQDVVDGRVPATGRRLQQLIPLASRYDQNFTGMQDYQTRMATAKSFAAGKDAETVKSYNQAITHADQLSNLIPKIENLNIGGSIGGAINAPIGAYRQATDPAYAKARTEYDTLTNALSGELMKASRGSGSGSVDEIRHWRNALQSANSGAEMRVLFKAQWTFSREQWNRLLRRKARDSNRNLTTLTC